jgi:hypothetical protein
MHTGQHLIYHAQNSTGDTIAKGAPVMFAGTNGGSGKLLIKPWDGTGPATLFMGITAEEFTNGHQGSVVAFGKVRDIQTNGDNYGAQDWDNGAIIYAGTNAVKLTNVKPSAPNPIVEVMAVIRAHASAGIVFVRPNYITGDVLGPSSVADNAIARFDGTTGKLIQTGGITIADNATGSLSGTNSGDVTLAGTPAYLTIANQVITRNQVNLTAASAHVTGTLPVANGGTGQNALSAIDAADFGAGAAVANAVLTSDGAGGAQWQLGSGAIENYIRTNTFTTSTATLANVTPFAVNVSPNEKVLIEIVGVKSTNASIEGMRIAFTGPANTVSVMYFLEAWVSTTGARITSQATSFATAVVDASGNTSAFPFRVVCIVEVGPDEGGTIQFQVGTENTSGGSVTISGGAFMRVYRI